MQNKITLKDNKVTSAFICVNFFEDKEYGDIVARCPQLRITTYGKTIDHAKEMFKEAFQTWIDTVNKDCDAKEVLKNLKWQLQKSQATVSIKPEMPKLPYIQSNSIMLNIPTPSWAN
jgi:hypothetical protein